MCDQSQLGCVFRDVLDSEDRKMRLTGRVRTFLASRAVVVGGCGTELQGGESSQRHQYGCVFSRLAGGRRVPEDACPLWGSPGPAGRPLQTHSCVVRDGSGAGLGQSDRRQNQTLDF